MHGNLKRKWMRFAQLERLEEMQLQHEERDQEQEQEQQDAAEAATLDSPGGSSAASSPVRAKSHLCVLCVKTYLPFFCSKHERLPWHAWGEHTRTRLRNERRFPPQGGSSSRPRSKKDAAFKAKLRADNARLQEEIERLRNQLYTQPGGAADGAAGPPGTPPLGNVGGDAAATAQQQEEQQQQQEEAAAAPAAVRDMWLAGAESPTESEKVARQKKLDEFKRRKDDEAARRKERKAERRKSQEAAALSAQQQAEATTAALKAAAAGRGGTQSASSN